MEVQMKRLLIGFLLGLALGSVAQGQDTKNIKSVTQSFGEGGTVWLKLASGNYSVRAGASDNVLVQWVPEDSWDQDEMKKIKVRTDLSGDTVTIRTEGPTKHARFTIEIPIRSRLYLRMRAGDVDISGIEGSKDIRITAGNLRVDAVPASYSSVHASVTFGDLKATPLGISMDGIGRSFDWNGSGKYTLYASLFAGDLTIVQSRELK
jgi:hypothetical protein